MHFYIQAKYISVFKPNIFLYSSQIHLCNQAKYFSVFKLNSLMAVSDIVYP